MICLERSGLAGESKINVENEFKLETENSEGQNEALYLYIFQGEGNVGKMSKTPKIY